MNVQHGFPHRERTLSGGSWRVNLGLAALKVPPGEVHMGLTSRWMFVWAELTFGWPSGSGDHGDQTSLANP